MLINFNYASAQQSLPEGATVRKKVQEKMLEFTKYHLIYNDAGGLDEIQKKYIDQKCDEADTMYTTKYLSQFQLDNLIPGKDVLISRNLPSERFFVSIIDDNTGEAYIGCKHYLKVIPLGYMAVKLDLEFLHEKNCDLSMDKVKIWSQKQGDKSTVLFSESFFKLRRQEQKQRRLPKNTNVCVISILKIEKVL